MNLRSPFLGGMAFILWAASLQGASLDKVSKTLAKGASNLKNKKVAVLAFPYHDGGVSSGSSIVSERITTSLVGKKGLRVVERRLIEQLLAEKKLSETGVIDQENLKTIGKILDVDAIVTGTLIDLAGDKTEINARMIRSDSGEVLSAGREIFERGWSDVPVKPRISEKPRPAPKVSAPEVSVDESVVLDDEEVSVRSPSTRKPLMKLSNENFAPGRRKYLANEAPPQNNSASARKNSVEDEEFEYRDDDNGRNPPSKDVARSKKTPQSQQKKTEESLISHPTKVGVVRKEYPPIR